MAHILTKTTVVNIKKSGWYHVLVSMKPEKWTVAFFDAEINKFKSLDGVIKPYMVDPRKIERFEVAHSKTHLLELTLNALAVGDSFCIKTFINNTWGSYDNYIRRSFDAMLAARRKVLSDKTFKTIRGSIKRTQ